MNKLALSILTAAFLAGFLSGCASGGGLGSAAPTMSGYVSSSASMRVK